MAILEKIKGSDGNNDGVFPNPFEDPTDLYPMTCQTCKSDEDMSAYCGICNERGHIACIADMPKTIKLHDEQKKGAKEFKLIPRLCVLCDKYHGSFYRVRKKCEELLLRLNQQAQLLGDDSAEAVAPTLSASSGGVGDSLPYIFPRWRTFSSLSSIFSSPSNWCSKTKCF